MTSELKLTIILVLDICVLERAFRRWMHGFEDDEGEENRSRIGPVRDAAGNERENPDFLLSVDLAVARDGSNSAGLLVLVLAGSQGRDTHTLVLLLQGPHEDNSVSAEDDTADFTLAFVERYEPGVPIPDLPHLVGVDQLTFKGLATQRILLRPRIHFDSFKKKG